MKTIIFDLFDTLLDKVWFDYNRGLTYLADTYFDNKREKLRLFADEYRERFMLERHETQLETSFINQLEFYERKFEKALSKPYDEIEWEFFSVCREETLAVGAKELLDYHCERGYTLAVLSNSIFSSDTLKKYLDKFGLLHYFEKVVSSADVTYRKPSVKAFESVLKAIGA